MRKTVHMRDAVYDLESTLIGMSLHQILLDDIHTELAWFSDDVSEKSQEQVTAYWHELKHKLRLLEALLLHSKSTFQKELTELKDLHTKFFDEIITNDDTKKA